MPEAEEVVIAVMGATGSGKSSFINTVSGSELAVGYGLKSCTVNVAHSNAFELFNRRITLVDTPGFDDTTVSDTDILKTIALYLSTTYEQGYKLGGVIYLHRISDVRLGGTSRKNFNMFRKLCGDSALHNVAIVTNMWGEVTPERGASRELELATDDLLFKPVLSLGAKMLRYDNTLSSAQSILLNLINNRPEALRIQVELVDEHKDIADTDAGQQLGQELTELSKKHRTQLAEVQKDLEEALRARDMQTKRELEQVRKDLEDRIAKSEHDRERLSAEYTAEKRSADQKVRDLMAALEGAQRSRAEREEKISRLMNAAEGLVVEREEWMRELRELEEQAKVGLFTKLGNLLDVVMEAAEDWMSANLHRHHAG